MVSFQICAIDCNDVFLSMLDIDALRWICDPSAIQIVDCRIRGVGGSYGFDGSVVAVHAGDGEAEAGVMGEPDEVSLRVEGDFRHLVEDDARVVGVIDCPLGSIEAGKADSTEVSGGG